jgi:lantibiotic modifying enzyme
LQNLTDVLFDFGKDSVKVFVVADSSLLETSLFTEKDGEMTILKVNGISNCEGVTGKYKFNIKEDQMVLTLISDSCSDRAEVLDKAVMTRM